MHQADHEQISLGERLLMAILAPLIFNVSLLICLALLARRSRSLGNAVLVETSTAGSTLVILLIAIPAAVGFYLGSLRCARLLGHFFYSNAEQDKSLAMTIVVWCGFFLIAFVVSRLPPFV